MKQKFSWRVKSNKYTLFVCDHPLHSAHPAKKDLKKVIHIKIIFMKTIIYLYCPSMERSLEGKMWKWESAPRIYS